MSTVLPKLQTIERPQNCTMRRHRRRRSTTRSLHRYLFPAGSIATVCSLSSSVDRIHEANK